MAIAAGADACPGGWICVAKDLATGLITSQVFETAEALVFQMPTPVVLMVDVPIGLTNAHRRRCDEMARELLRSRHVCVFSAPIRPALHCTSREAASETTLGINGRRVGCQVWGIVPKIRSMDAILTSHPDLQTRVFEVHPEVSFCEWNGGQPIASGKKSRDGKRIRQDLLGREQFENVRQHYKVSKVGHDDIADAFAALWTAERKCRNEAIAIPLNPPVDDFGLRMEIWR